MRSRAITALLLILLICLAVDCKRKSALQNILLITMDTTRFDYFQHAQHLKPRTSGTNRLQTLLKRSAVQNNAVTSINSTNPAHLSILTSQYPAALGVHSNLERYDKQFPTLAEVLKARGYLTAAVVSALHLGNPKFNILKGFDDQVVPRNFFPAARVTDFGIYWLSKFHKKKFLLWLHYFDPHVVYEPPKDFRRADVDLLPRHQPEKDVPTKVILNGNPFFQHWEFGEMIARWASKYSSLNQIQRLYMGEILYMCSEIERFLGYFDSLGISQNTLIVLVADHGESLGEHGIYFDHMGLYEPQIKVPLAIFDPTGSLQAGNHDDLVETVDLFPTILELLRVPAPAEIAGKSLVFREDSAQLKSHQPIAITENTDLLQVSARTEKWKLILPVKEDKILDNSLQLYDLAGDPEERMNVLAAHPQTAQQLQNVLSGYTRGSRSGSRPALSPEEIENLRSLGYLGKSE